MSLLTEKSLTSLVVCVMLCLMLCVMVCVCDICVMVCVVLELLEGGMIDFMLFWDIGN